MVQFQVTIFGGQDSILKIDLEADVIPEIGQIHLLQTFSESRTDLKVEDQDRESTTRTRMSIRMMVKKRM